VELLFNVFQFKSVSHLYYMARVHFLTFHVSVQTLPIGTGIKSWTFFHKKVDLIIGLSMLISDQTEIYTQPLLYA